MEVKTITLDGFFRVFTSCPQDPKTFILDVRSQKEFAKQHVMQAYSIRLAANGKALLDYSKNTYDVKWTEQCWWDKPVVIYGDASLKRDHPVVAYLAKDNHAKNVAILKEGFEAFQKAYPFLCTASVKNNAVKRFPGEIVPKVLYLGDWHHAEQVERLDELGIKRVITIHNNPENLALPARFRHLRFQAADVDTVDITQFFAPSYAFVEEGRAAGEAVLVHCGAGVSRSASLAAAYLMRRFTWPAARARAHLQARRSIACPNQGFWRSLCAFEEQLGVADRSNPADTIDFHGADAPVLLSEGAAGTKVLVKFVPAGKAGDAAILGTAADQRDAEPSGRGREGADDAREGAERREKGEDRHDRKGGREGSRDEGERRKRDRDRDRHRDRDRDRHRDRDGDGRHREGDSSTYGRDGGRRRSRDHSAERNGDAKRTKREEPEADGAKTAAAKGSEAAAEVGETKQPGVILEVAKEGRVLGSMELGLDSIADRVVFGRAPTCDVVVEHLSCSRAHAQLTVDTGGNLYVTDLGTSHGTNVDGTWIRSNEARQLPKGAVFKLAASSRQYKVLQRPRDIRSAPQLLSS